MDPYDSHPAHGRDRSPESATPIYDRLLAEWRAAALNESAPRDTAPGAQASGRPPHGREGAFVPAARTAGGAGGGGR